MIEISHLQARRLIHLRLDGELPNEQWLALQAHLESCADCAVYQVQLNGNEKRLRHMLRRRWSSLNGPVSDPALAIRSRAQQRTRANIRTKRSASLVGVSLILVMCSVLAYQQAFAPLPPTLVPTTKPKVILLTSTPEPEPLPFSGVIAYTHRNPAPASDSDICLLTVFLYRTETLCFSDPAEDSDPVWSPDGQHMAFVSDRAERLILAQGQSAAWTPALVQRRDIFRMNADGSELIRLTPGFEIDWQGPVSWSADGRQLAAVGYQRASNTSWIYQIAADGSGKFKPIGHTRFGLWPNFSPVGSNLAFQMDDGGFKGLAVVDLTGETYYRLTGQERQTGLESSEASHFDWSADGSRLVYLARGSQPDGISISEVRASMSMDQGFFDQLVLNEPGESLSTLLASSAAGQPLAGPLLSPAWVPTDPDSPDGLPGGVIYLQPFGWYAHLKSSPNPSSSMDSVQLAALKDSKPCWQPTMLQIKANGPRSVETNILPMLCALTGFDRLSWAAGRQAGEHWLVLYGLGYGGVGGGPGIFALRSTLADGKPEWVRLADVPESDPPWIEGPLRVKPVP